MALILIMVEGGEIGHGSGSQVTGGLFDIINDPSDTCRAEGQRIYRELIRYTFVGGDYPGADAGSVGTVVPQEIDPTAVKVRADGELVIRLGDVGVMGDLQATFSGTPGTVPDQPVEIVDAGQVTVRAE